MKKIVNRFGYPFIVSRLTIPEYTISSKTNGKQDSIGPGELQSVDNSIYTVQ
ncbi:hypothetical protein JXQ31_00530 [candidate division KSB1 bacterium]|nr:hypothetical protein [candidate division KSB1 bacterium]